jgi:hypothetical protein
MIFGLIALVGIVTSMAPSIPLLDSISAGPFVSAFITGSEYPVFLGFTFDFPENGISTVSMTVEGTSLNVPVGEFTSNIVLRPDVSDNGQLSSVSILANHRLAFNETREHFLQNRCLNQSFFAVPLLLDLSDHSANLRVRYALIENGVDAESRAFHLQTQTARLDAFRNSMFSLPHELFYFIRGRVETFAPTFLNDQFTNCEHVLQRLPYIKASFIGVDSMTAEIVLSPSDYTVRNGDACCLGVDPHDDEYSFVNPFRLTGINTHLTALDLGFCDSRD